MSSETTETTPGPEQKFAKALPHLVMNLAHFVLMAAAVRDLRQRPEAEINGNKRLWYGIVLIQIVGPIAYFAIGRKREAEGGVLAAPESEPQIVDATRLAEA